MITEIAWEVHRRPYNALDPRSRTITYYSATVSGTEYLTAKAEDGEWRWDCYIMDKRAVAGKARRTDGGSRPTLKAAKAAALDAWNAREERS